MQYNKKINKFIKTSIEEQERQAEAFFYTHTTDACSKLRTIKKNARIDGASEFPAGIIAGN